MALEPLIGEIILFSGNFAPRGWFFCQGQLLSISQFQALFSILGTTYGGNGSTTFALPDLRGRAPIGTGHGPGLSYRNLGQQGGAEDVWLNVNQIPSHNHLATGTTRASSGPGTSTDPSGRIWARLAREQAYGDVANTTMMGSSVDVTVSNSGGSQSHTNMQPWLALHYIIAYVGIYPSRD